MKQIVVDRYGVIVGFCTGEGYIEGGIDVDDIPADFKYAKYKYEGGEIVPNPEYAAADIEGKYYDLETGGFVSLAPPEATFEEKQVEFNLNIDYRTTCLELGLT